MRLSKLRALIALIAAIPVIFAVAAASAQVERRHVRPPPHPVARPSFSMRLENESGSSLRSYAHRGQTFVLGEPGERFVIAVTNPTAQRVEAVVSVDGRDAISGQVASFTRQRGYIVPPGGTVRIEGFRQSLDDVATFRFTSRDNSYSARMGTPQNVGVIGVAFFPERAQAAEIVRRDRVLPPRHRVMPAPAAPARGENKSKSAARRPAASGEIRAEQDRASNIGTEYGETRTHRVVEVPFDRVSNTPARVITIRYDDADGLMARGIELFERPQPRPVRHLEDEFTQARPAARFAPPPR